MSPTRLSEIRSASALPRDFRVLWAAQGVSAFGSSMAYVATPWLAYSLTHSGVGTAVTTACAIAPYPLFGVVAGALVDGFPQRTVMVMADLLSALVAALLAAAEATGRLSLPLLAAGVFVLGALAVLFDAANVTLVAYVVPRARLGAANGLTEVTAAGAKLIGPLVAGVVLAGIGAATVFAVDAVSCLVGALGSVLLTTRGSERRSGGDRARVRDGLGYLLHHPLVRSLTVATTFVAIGIGAFEALLVPLLRGGLGYGQVAVGAAYAAGGLGWLVGALLIGRARVDGAVPRLVVGALEVSAGAGLALAWIGRLPVTLAAVAAYDAGIYATLIMTITIRQQVVPRELLGRVHATARAVANTGNPLGALLAAAAVGALPVRAAAVLLLVAPLVGALAFLVVASSRRPSGGPDHHRARAGL